jgi:hypothetical protein
MQARPQYAACGLTLKTIDDGTRIDYGLRLTKLSPKVSHILVNAGEVIV